MLTFKQLSVGDTFVFGSERPTPHSGIATGPWRKASDRTYTHCDNSDPLYHITIDSVDCKVLRTEAYV